MEPFGLGSPIPSLIWEAFQEALQGNMRRLAKDIAKTLLQPDAPLIQAIMTKTIKPYIFEEVETGDLDMRCDYLCARGCLLQKCHEPILWSAGIARCPEHIYLPPVTSSLQIVYPLELEEQLYITEDGTAYDEGFMARGRFDLETKRLTLFTVVCETQEPRGCA